MKKYYGHPEFYKLVEEIKEIHSKKNRDYAGDDPLSNLRLCEQFGIPPWLGVLVRMSDKYSRIVQLASGKQPAVKEEKITDTLKDLAVYSLLCVILYKERK